MAYSDARRPVSGLVGDTMKRLVICLGVLAALVAWSGWSGAVHAQTTGQISGVVKGPSGPLDHVTINVIDANGKVVGTAKTGADGTYSIGHLPVGTYTVQVVNSADKVIATSVGTVSTTVTTATVDVTLTATQLTGLAIGASSGLFGLGAGGTGLLLGGTLGGGLFLHHALTSNSSPNR